MNDLLFDIVTRELVMADNDLVTTSNPSVQNGGILLFSRCAFINNPMIGVGMEQTIGGSPANATFELNRWKQQAIADGATLATWNASYPNGNLTFETNQSYL